MSENEATTDPLAEMAAEASLLELMRMYREMQIKYGPKFRTRLDLAASLWPFPDWSDPNATRDWFRQHAGTADQLAELTATDIDDNAAAALHAVVADNETWLAFYTLFESILESFKHPRVSGVSFAQRAETIAETTATTNIPIGPSLILALARGTAEIAEFLRDYPKPE